MATCIGISIGSTNAYVAINGEAVANADGFRNTKTMVTEDLEVGQAAIGKWVRQPESLLDRTSEKFWKALLEDLNETAKSNAGTEIDTAIVNIVIPSSDDKELVTKVGSEIFKNLQVIDNQATVLAQSKKT
jgi:molecular chaperone DnaK (HSP70)